MESLLKKESKVQSVLSKERVVYSVKNEERGPIKDASAQTDHRAFEKENM